MFLISVIKHSILRAIKRYSLKCLIMSSIIFIFTVSVLSWKFDRELERLNSIRIAQLINIEKMLNLTTEKFRTKDTWRSADLTHAAIFSAYLDLRPEVILEEVLNASGANLWALIRIIGIIAVSSEDEPLTCYYKYPSASIADSESPILESPAVAVRVISGTENFGMSYSAAFVLCKLITTPDGRLPLAVTFSSDGGKTARDLEGLDFAEVHYSTRTSSYSQDRFMAACVPSLHHGFDKHENLIEFVEFYRMMGVEHFTFYNTSVSEEVSRVLAYYENLNLATVIQWQLPPRYVFERTLRYNGIFAAMNECLYRNTMVGGFKYIINVDLDEFVVPRKHENFLQMMEFLDPDSENNKNAVFLIRNMFFYLMHEDNPFQEYPPGLPKLLLQSKTTRWVNVNPAHDRSKYIARSQDVVEMGNHRVWQTRKRSLVFRTSFGEKVVDPDIAGSHHYRYCEVNELVCWLRGTIQDTSAHKFTRELGTRVGAVFKLLFKK